MTTIAKRYTIKFNYTLKDDEGDVLTNHQKVNRLPIYHGHSNIIPGLEKQLEGKSAGEQIKRCC